MRLTVLGSAASFAGAGQACAGHYLEAGGVRLLLDCGNGVLANLQKIADPYALDAVFVSHYHPDHYADVLAMQAMLRYAPSGPLAPKKLYLPEGLFERIECLLSERGVVELHEAFSVEVLQAGVPIHIGDVTVTPLEVDHAVPTFALCVDADGSRLCYTSDTSPGERALAAVAGADMVLAEATLPEEFSGVAPHMTASEAGKLAAASGAAVLALVHIWPTNDRALTARLAAEHFSGEVHVASEFDTFEVPRRDHA